MVLKHYPTSICPLLSPALTSPLHPRLTHPSVYLGVQPNMFKTNSKPTPFNFLISVTDTSVLLVALVKQLGVPLAVSLTLHSIHQHILSTPHSIQDLISSHRPRSSTKVLGNTSICHSGFLNGLLVSTPFPTVQSTFHATPRVDVGLHHPLTPCPQLPSQGKSCGSHQGPQVLQDTEHLQFLLPSQGSPSSLCSYPPLFLTHAQPAPGSRPLFTLSPPPTLSPDLCHSLPPFLQALLKYQLKKEVSDHPTRNCNGAPSPHFLFLCSVVPWSTCMRAC